MARLLRLLGLSTLLGMYLLVAAPGRAEAAPDPVVASVMSVGATALPLAITGIMWGTGRGADEGVRLDVGMIALGLGSIVGPSAGQIYAHGGVDAFLTFLLRAVTGAVMLTGVGFKLRGAENKQLMGSALAITGAVPTGLLAIYDMYAASVSAREAGYREGYGQVVIPPDLQELAVCGPIPCPVGDRTLLAARGPLGR
ncbi:MAG: hypothetical protein KC933_16915 [Myxococcales bacterium]|nr:hypothetical protein [Myxococcales bacterium]MCB9651564.1 hypothetical protein [Deltaproteobacteria bacterium]